MGYALPTGYLLISEALSYREEDYAIHFSSASTKLYDALISNFPKQQESTSVQHPQSIPSTQSGFEQAITEPDCRWGAHAVNPIGTNTSPLSSITLLAKRLFTLIGRTAGMQMVR